MLPVLIISVLSASLEKLTAQSNLSQLGHRGAVLPETPLLGVYGVPAMLLQH